MVFIDSNIWIYAFIDFNNIDKQNISKELIIR